MKKREIREYWSPVWGKIVAGVCFNQGSELGGGMAIVSNREKIEEIEGSKAFKAGRIKRVDKSIDNNPAAEQRGTVALYDPPAELAGTVASGTGATFDPAAIDPQAELAGTVASGTEAVGYEDVVSFQAARDIVIKAMKEAGEEVKFMNSKAAVKAEARRLGIEFPNLK